MVQVDSNSNGWNLQMDRIDFIDYFFDVFAVKSANNPTDWNLGYKEFKKRPGWLIFLMGIIPLLSRSDDRSAGVMTG